MNLAKRLIEKIKARLRLDVKHNTVLVELKMPFAKGKELKDGYYDCVEISKESMDLGKQNAQLLKQMGF